MNPADPILICTDLDRTLLPNGLQPESPKARPLFARLAALPEVSIAYVTGRDRRLVEAAIAEYALPQPDFVIADVGTTLYRIQAGEWQRSPSWEAHIGTDWAGLHHDDLAALFADLPMLRLQEPEKQTPFKLSYYAPPESDPTLLLEQLEARLEAHGVRARLVWSVDETQNLGLLDLLPARAGKRWAIEFLLAQAGFRPEQTLFAGDSGNDLEVLESPLPSVLVANATEQVRRRAVEQAGRLGTLHTLYLAKGAFLGMNGNYSAGILEGAAHFIPQIAHWLQVEELRP